ncbi:MAG: uroporphyrinogen decarboxylase, partial [Chloroflexota bacterium]|nr:uroporphyrinogen decarboxylase [Chloroflexota bacterium]
MAKASKIRNDQFLRACRRESTDFTPVWLMRQAGRYMEEYRRIREKHGFLTMCKTPDIATEVTLQPVSRLGVDAAILFADILLPLEGMGLNLEFAKNEGPVLHNPIATEKDVEALRVTRAEEATPFVLEAVRGVVKELKGAIPLIGFSGAPFTLASYAIEGGGSRNYVSTKTMMFSRPDLWDKLMRKISDVVTDYLIAQIHSGAQAVQLFDSWVGCLSPEDYRQYVLPFSQSVIDGLKAENVPVIHFGTDSAMLLSSMREAGGDVIGVDWRINLDDAWRQIGYDRAIQGNLDPVVLFSNLGSTQNHGRRPLVPKIIVLGGLIPINIGIIITPTCTPL